MTDKNLENVGKMFFELKTAILNNEDVRKLLYYDSSDALSRTAPSIDDVSGYVFNAPIMESGIEDFNRNTYIMIDLPSVDMDFEDGNHTLLPPFMVTAITNYAHWELDNNKLRLIELCDRIIKQVDNIKFSMSAKSYVLTMERVIISKQLYGYTLKIWNEDNVTKEDF